MQVGRRLYIMDAWKNFVGGDYEKRIDVRNFIQKNYTPYEGDDFFNREHKEQLCRYQG